MQFSHCSQQGKVAVSLLPLLHSGNHQSCDWLSLEELTIPVRVVSQVVDEGFTENTSYDRRPWLTPCMGHVSASIRESLVCLVTTGDMNFTWHRPLGEIWTMASIRILPIAQRQRRPRDYPHHITRIRFTFIGGTLTIFRSLFRSATDRWPLTQNRHCAFAD